MTSRPLDEHASHRPSGAGPRRRASPTLADPIRYLGAADVDALLPDLGGQVELAARALRGLGEDAAEMPPKLGVHPRPGALLHAMPAWYRPDDVVGVKWVSAFSGNGSRGIPAISGLVVLNDPDTGLPVCILDAARITAVRTAAVSGVALRLFVRPGMRSAAILGAGVQARSHLPHLARALPDGDVVIYDRHRERAERLAAEALAAGFRTASAGTSARAAVTDADVVVTVGALGSQSQLMTADWLRPGALVVAVDFATYVAAELARVARRFVVDDRAQFLAYRAAGHFDGYPEPGSTMGEELARATATAPSTDEARDPASPAPEHTVVTHLGVGLADVLFADAVRAAAEERGVGMLLPR